MMIICNQSALGKLANLVLSKEMPKIKNLKWKNIQKNIEIRKWIKIIGINNIEKIHKMQDHKKVKELKLKHNIIHK